MCVVWICIIYMYTMDEEENWGWIGRLERGVGGFKEVPVWGWMGT